MCALVIDSFAVFVLCLALHAIAWRIRRPASYGGWLPTLVVIFGPVGAAVAWLIVPAPLEWAAVLLLHGTFAAVYVVGYTLVSAFSPSIELLKLLDRTPAGIPASSLRLPFLAGALTSDRIDNLAAARLVRQNGARLQLGPRGVTMTRMVLLYRHAVGLRDGEGG